MKPGSEGTIKRLSIRDKLGQRLMDMGVYPGLKLKVIRNAPLEDPMELELDGYFVSLRHDEGPLRGGHTIVKSEKTLVALAGQPNCGKSTVFNASDRGQPACGQLSRRYRGKDGPDGTGTTATELKLWTCREPTVSLPFHQRKGSPGISFFMINRP